MHREYRAWQSVFFSKYCIQITSDGVNSLFFFKILKISLGVTASSKDVGSATLQESRNAKRQKIKNWVF